MSLCHVTIQVLNGKASGGGGKVQATCGLGRITPKSQNAWEPSVHNGVKED